MKGIRALCKTAGVPGSLTVAGKVGVGSLRDLDEIRDKIEITLALDLIPGNQLW